MLRWRRRRHTTEHEAPSIAEEVQHFLEGRRLDDVFAQGSAAPAWVWLSCLAHGDEEVLSHAQQWLRDHGGVRPELDSWGRVLELLARKVRATLDVTGCSLHDLQRDILVPLEEAVMQTPVGPATLYRILSTTLAEVAAQVGIEQI